MKSIHQHSLSVDDSESANNCINTTTSSEFFPDREKITKPMNCKKKTPQQGHAKIAKNAFFNNPVQIIDMEGLDGWTLQKITDERVFRSCCRPKAAASERNNSAPSA